MKLPAYATTIALVAIFLFLSLPNGGGIWFVFAAPVFIVWALYNLVRMHQKQAEGRSRGIRLAIWMAALVLAGVTQGYWASASRDHGDAAAATLLAHASRAGAYPSSLDEVGLNEQALKSEWRLKYNLRDGKPQLNYPAAFLPLTLYEYNFETRTWITNSY